MDRCVLLTSTPSCVVSPRGETTHSGVDVNNTHLSMINPLNYIHYIVWDEITYQFLKINGATAEVLEWISIFIPHFTRHVIAYPCWDQVKPC